MTDDELAQLIQQGHETPGVEFKGDGSFSDMTFRARVIRAMMAMANRRGGGVIVLGVRERPDRTLDPVGMAASEVPNWAHDALAGSASGYCEPSVSFRQFVLTFDEKQFLVLRVDEFSEAPIVCRKEYVLAADPAAGRPEPKVVLRRGGFYVRSTSAPSSVQLAEHEDLRAVLDLAVEKGVRRWVELTRSAGLLPPGPQPEGTTSAYDSELRSAL